MIDKATMFKDIPKNNQVALCKKYKITDSTLRKYLRKYELYDYYRTFSRNRTIDETLFISDSLSDTHFYFLGLFAADGSIQLYKGGVSFRIYLQERDRNVLENLNKWLCKRTELVKRTFKILNRSKQCGINFSSCYAYNWFKKYGVDENKSKYFNVKLIPNKWFFSFLRGFIDGDGTVDRNTVELLCYSEMVLEEICDRINDLGIKVSKDIKRNEANNIYRLRVSVYPMRFLYEKMYKEGVICLERKRNKLKGCFIAVGRKDKFDRETIRGDFRRGMSVKEVRRKYNIGHGTAYRLKND